MPGQLEGAGVSTLPSPEAIKPSMPRVEAPSVSSAANLATHLEQTTNAHEGIAKLADIQGPNGGAPSAMETPRLNISQNSSEKVADTSQATPAKDTAQPEEPQSLQDLAERQQDKLYREMNGQDRPKDKQPEPFPGFNEATAKSATQAQEAVHGPAGGAAAVKESVAQETGPAAISQSPEGAAPSQPEQTSPTIREQAQQQHEQMQPKLREEMTGKPDEVTSAEAGESNQEQDEKSADKAQSTESDVQRLQAENSRLTEQLNQRQEIMQQPVAAMKELQNSIAEITKLLQAENLPPEKRSALGIMLKSMLDAMMVVMVTVFDATIGKDLGGGSVAEAVKKNESTQEAEEQQGDTAKNEATDASKKSQEAQPAPEQGSNWKGRAREYFGGEIKRAKKTVEAIPTEAQAKFFDAYANMRESDAQAMKDIGEFVAAPFRERQQRSESKARNLRSKAANYRQKAQTLRSTAISTPAGT